MFYVEGKGELIDPSQQKFPKRWPDNRGPVIIRIDGSNLLLMIRKMRSSRPHFKYIFHYGGSWQATLLISPPKPFTVSLPPSEIQYPYFTRHNVSLWWCLDCPKLKAFVLKLRGELQAPSQYRDIDVFYFVLSHWIQYILTDIVFPRRNAPPPWPQSLQPSATIQFPVNQTAIVVFIQQ